jgi:1,2-phenylacetyl-CoA epoxidase catalytic subunit
MAQMTTETWHAIPSSIDTIYQRDYEVYAPDMRRLYENAKRDQWNVSRDIDWSAPVDPERGVFHDGLIDAFGSPYWEKLDAKQRRELNLEFSAWRLSQLLHGESGAMIACSQLVQMVPTTDAKFFMTTQVVDEARHAEVLARYIKEKLGNKVYPMTTNLKSLFDQLIGSSKWYIKTIGLQLVAETLAVSLFRMLAESAQDPLLSVICRRILSDESRHMGFSVLSLPEQIEQLSETERHEVEDFTKEALRLVMSGQFPREAYEAVGFNKAEVDGIERYRQEVAKGTEQAMFRQLFRRDMHQQVVANMDKVGLLNDRIKSHLSDLGFDPNAHGRSYLQSAAAAG